MPTTKSAVELGVTEPLVIVADAIFALLKTTKAIRSANEKLIFVIDDRIFIVFIFSSNNLLNVNDLSARIMAICVDFTTVNKI